MYVSRKKKFHFQRSGWKTLIYEKFINLQGVRCWEGYTKDDLWKSSHLNNVLYHTRHRDDLKKKQISIIFFFDGKWFNLTEKQGIRKSIYAQFYIHCTSFMYLMS